jgi:hypothetical protein
MDMVDEYLLVVVFRLEYRKILSLITMHAHQTHFEKGGILRSDRLRMPNEAWTCPLFSLHANCAWNKSWAKR